MHMYIYICVYIMHINDDDEEEGNKEGEIRKGSLPCGVTLGSALSKNRYKKINGRHHGGSQNPKTVIYIYIYIYVGVLKLTYFEELYIYDYISKRPTAF